MKKRSKRESSEDFHHDTMEAFAKEEMEQACNTTSSCLHGKKRPEQESSENIATMWKPEQQHHYLLLQLTLQSTGRQVSPHTNISPQNALLLNRYTVLPVQTVCAVQTFESRRSCSRLQKIDDLGTSPLSSWQLMSFLGQNVTSYHKSMCNFREKQHYHFQIHILINFGGFHQTDSFPMQFKTINFKLSVSFYLDIDQ